MSRLDQLQKLLDRDPGDVDLLYMLAMEYKSAGRLEEASSKFSECIRLRPDHAAAYLQMGHLHRTAGRSAEAREVLLQGIAKARQAGETHAADEMQHVLSSLSD